MKFVTTLGLLLLSFAFSAFGQTDKSTRPRVATTATPPRIANEPYKSSTPNSPPVLSGSSRYPNPSSLPTPPAKAGDDNEVIKVETNLVTMPVSVLDREGRFIAGLQQKDFQIFENGIQQKVDYFQSVEQPFTVVLLIDVSPSTQFKIDEIQNAAITFVNQLRPGDRVMVISFDEDVHVLSPVTGNRNQLRSAIREARFGDGTSLYDAVDYVIDNQLRQIDGRKAVVLFSDGVDTTSRHANYDSTLRSTEEADAIFYTLRYDTSRDMGGNFPGPGSRGGQVSIGDILGAILSGGNVNTGRGGGSGSRGEYDKGRKYLEMLAQNSGGREFEAQSLYNVEAAFSGIAEELRRQYSLGYYPENVGKVGDRKQIKIRVMRPNVVVRAKNSYIVGQTTRNVAGR
ncbi:MAG: VWA domain-containing protein [Chloracidobacterium sp.]|nr:VWA domain-containing protein [Chloracidobacterium sp.]